MSDAYKQYWRSSVEDVPHLTGAASVMDLSDLNPVFETMGIPFSRLDVLDVGCGTGRLASICGSWVGCDINPAAVEYCRNRGLACFEIDGPDDLPVGDFDITVALSVFTHISREDRRAYMRAFNTEWVLADVIEGEEGGTPGVWRANVDDFLADSKKEGYAWGVSATNTAPSREVHRYYLFNKVR